ncbi:nitroreductase family protein [Candidatus Bipolaricaulota bacterium]|nr:nitroreductase family protein [Candidatus Bipolaricaulota bacterium]
MSAREASRILEGVIRGRRSIRKYTDTAIDIGRLVRLVTLGTWAPTGGNAQTWRFVVVSDAATIRAIHAVSPGIGVPPPAVIVICQDRKLAEEKGGAMGRDQCAPMDAAMAAQTIMLAAHAEGLGTCAVLSFHPGSVQQVLALPEEIVPELLLSVGHPVHEEVPPPRKIAAVIHIDRWGRPLDRVPACCPASGREANREGRCNGSR